MRSPTWKNLANPLLTVLLAIGLIAGTLQAVMADAGTPEPTPTETPTATPTDIPDEPTVPAPTDVPDDPTATDIPTDVPTATDEPTDVPVETPTAEETPTTAPATPVSRGDDGGVVASAFPYPDGCGVKDDGFFTFTNILMQTPYPGFRTNDYAGGFGSQGPGSITGYTNPAHGTLYMNPDLGGGFSYMPEPGFVGTDSFQYEITCRYYNFPSDPETHVQVGTVYLYVLEPTGTPNPPATPSCVQNDVYFLPALNPTLSIPARGVLGNDTGYYTYNGMSPAQHGSLSSVGTGGFDYTPDPGFTGTDQFFYSVTCGIPGINAHVETAMVLIHVQPDIFANSCAFDNSYTTAANTALVVPKASGFLSDDYAYSYLQSTGAPMHGTLSGLDGEGGFTYTPMSGYVGTDTFTYRLACIGGVRTETGTVTITVTGDGLPSPTPTMTPTMDPNATATATMMPSMTPTMDPNATATMTPTMDPNATATMTPTPASTINPTMTATLDPSVTVTATMMPTMTATIDPSATVTNTPSVTPTIDPSATVTNTPTASATTTVTCMVNDDSYEVRQDIVLSIPAPGVFTNDTLDGHPLHDVLPASHGMATVGSMGELTYTPDPGFHGTDSFIYRVNCGNPGTPRYVDATVTLIVRPAAGATMTPTLDPDATATTMPTMTPTLDPDATATTMPPMTPTLDPDATATTMPTMTPTLDPSVTVTATTMPTMTATIDPSATATMTATMDPDATATATNVPATVDPGNGTITPTQDPSCNVARQGLVRTSSCPTTNGQATPPDVSKLPVTGAGTSTPGGMNLLIPVLAGLLILAAGIGTALGSRRRA